MATWSSSNTGVATVSSTGMVTAVAAGTANITASMDGFPGTIVASATLTVSASASLTSLSIIPGNQTVESLNETAQYIAVGSLEGQDGAVTDLTNSVTWVSSDVKVATINSSGLATGINLGSTTITAIAKNPDGSVLTATATFTEGATGEGTQLPSLTVYKVGNNAAIGTVTAIGTNDPDVTVINSGKGAGCVANFPIGTTVTLTAIPGPGSTFGGWSSECTPDNQPTCTVTVPPSVGGVVDDNATVGAIFN